MLSNSYHPKQNQLINMLPSEDFEHISPHLEFVQLSLGEVLYESGENLYYVYFPIDCIISMLYVLENGSSAEIAVIGFEGAIGLSLFMSGQSMPHRAVVQSKGCAYRIKHKHFMQEFNRHTGLLCTMLKYTQVLLTQMAQTAVCNRHHSIDQQLCRWLLLSLDRLHANELFMTQELIANMLGVRREGVTDAARKLQQAGLIQYRRGHITVLDRIGLEARVCECYHVVKTESDRLLGIEPAETLKKHRIPIPWVRYPATPEESRNFSLERKIRET
ncbi:Crp/Fnr family transcriptional regulator [Nitrosomonas sp. Nm166]|uniref:Crp/Fnr family transcriptional regulator n=1 Tax=Nitrosomonas sp. Nm166 TaxID=1881054 RepID=UPI0008F3926B|nr:Crp/Fnr family transcriptional regulator [Nitrosomonas sp. Nm166]SFF09245.1 cAMP-binding domain of CRP or a regulatory subunit of cAMP-dependent protein kinases [Nitrosomonas sp. Nm166]